MEANKKIRIFDGATAIVTGAASGIGRALASESSVCLRCSKPLALMRNLFSHIPA